MFERDLDVTKRDRFELLSAYLDGEVTPEERQLIQGWLATDPSVKCLYQRLLQLRQGFQNLPQQHQPCSTESTLSQVLETLSQRIRLACTAGTGVCVLGVLGLLSGVFGPRYGLLNLASVHSTPPENGGQAALQVSLDQPVFSMPDTFETPPLTGDSFIPVESEM